MDGKWRRDVDTSLNLDMLQPEVLSSTKSFFVSYKNIPK